MADVIAKIVEIVKGLIDQFTQKYFKSYVFYKLAFEYSTTISKYISLLKGGHEHEHRINYHRSR